MIPAAAWAPLAAELAAWHEAGLEACFWWRDDDAAEATPALSRLLDLRRQAGIPLALAVIPARATAGLAQALQNEDSVCAVQHGHSHQNHAVTGTKKSEFPPGRPVADSLAALATGQARLLDLFADRFLPLLVPPWNRFDDNLLPALPGLQFTAISAYTARSAYWAAPGLARLNAHLDPVDWHGEPVGDAAATCLAIATDLLAGMRRGHVALQPIGLLSHHLRHDNAGWDFLATFLARTARQPAVRWISARNALEIGKTPADVMPPS